MTTPVRLTHPVDYIAIAPYLLGFRPSLSIVGISFQDGALMGVLRFDLPDRSEDVVSVVSRFAEIMDRSRVEQVFLIGYGPGALVTPIMDGLHSVIEALDTEIMDMVRCEDNRYWSYCCEDPECCPPEGTPYDETTSHAAVGAVIAGLSAMPSRQAFADRLAPVEGTDREAVRLATRTARARADALLNTATPRYWYDEGHARVSDAFDRQEHTADEIAWLGVLLTSILVRDMAMTLLGLHSAEAHIQLWTEVARRVQPEYAAPPATLLAFAAYYIGDGTLARIAVARALSADPGYRMAAMLCWALDHGIEPTELHRMNIADQAEAIEAQVERCPRAAIPMLPETNGS